VRLFHFSEDPAIARFDPRSVRVPVERPPGKEWLNGVLVWAIDDAHGFLYLFPRECPRVLLWPTPATTEADRERWLAGSTGRAIAYIEQAWADRMAAAAINRYELPTNTFEDARDVGMWVSRSAVTPARMDRLTELPARLAEQNVELRIVDSLTPLKRAWDTTIHASGIRLRNALDWGPPGWPHTPNH
jgi:hypothetical protein